MTIITVLLVISQVMVGKCVHREMGKRRLHGAAAALNSQTVTVATVKSKATVIMGEVGNSTVEVMFDSGSAVSLLWKSDMNQMSLVQHVESG